MIAGGRSAGYAAAVLGLVLWATAATAGEGTAYTAPGPQARCPTCGMFVAGFPEWVAQVVLADGSRLWFDGVKDLARHLRELPESEVAAVWVTDYYSLNPLDGRSAWFVSGSDVLGPMGEEFVPFAGREQAETFLRDHGGKAVLGFEELLPVTP